LTPQIITYPVLCLEHLPFLQHLEMKRPDEVLKHRRRAWMQAFSRKDRTVIKDIFFWKAAATTGGIALTANAVWLNACHIAGAEGWTSPLVSAGVIVTICAAGTPPLAERAAKTAQPLKAVLLWAFFALALGFSLTTSISRSSGYADGKIAAAEKIAEKAKLAKEAYAAAQATQADECKRRGPKCRAAEDAVVEARRSLVIAAPAAAVNSGAERVSAVLGVSEASVEMYSPLLLPLALELGGFVLLALGLAPRGPAARRREADTVAIDEAVASAKTAEGPGVPAKPIAKSASGTKTYYQQRLERDHPAIAKRVRDGELSVYKASVMAGIRKSPGKDWSKPGAYGIETASA
jgi:hypothetical protein